MENEPSSGVVRGVSKKLGGLASSTIFEVENFEEEFTKKDVEIGLQAASEGVKSEDFQKASWGAAMAVRAVSRASQSSYVPYATTEALAQRAMAEFDNLPPNIAVPLPAHEIDVVRDIAYPTAEH